MGFRYASPYPLGTVNTICEIYKLALKLHSSGICQVLIALLKPQGKCTIAPGSHPRFNYAWSGSFIPWTVVMAWKELCLNLVIILATKRKTTGSSPPPLQNPLQQAKLLFILQMQLRSQRPLWLQNSPLSILHTWLFSLWIIICLFIYLSSIKWQRL